VEAIRIQASGYGKFIDRPASKWQMPPFTHTWITLLLIFNSMQRKTSTNTSGLRLKLSLLKDMFKGL